ncbi:hypothetical protein S7335_242 [Synechococcus sp. PCC 7335]|nr:hypothetical protein S7335_242 [Synechococcus sp. PCC 7335]
MHERHLYDFNHRSFCSTFGHKLKDSSSTSDYRKKQEKPD